MKMTRSIGVVYNNRNKFDINSNNVIRGFPAHMETHNSMKSGLQNLDDVIAAMSNLFLLFVYNS